MVRRHRRRNSLTDAERERFAREGGEAHARLLPYLIALSPGCDEYRAIQALSAALQTAIREVTGEEPVWCKVGPRRMPGG